MKKGIHFERYVQEVLKQDYQDLDVKQWKECYDKYQKWIKEWM